MDFENLNFNPSLSRNFQDEMEKQIFRALCVKSELLATTSNSLTTAAIMNDELIMSELKKYRFIK